MASLAALKLHHPFQTEKVQAGDAYMHGHDLTLNLLAL